MKQKLNTLLKDSVSPQVYGTIRYIYRKAVRLLRAFTRIQSFVFLFFYQSDLEAFLGRILSTHELSRLPDSRTLLKHLTRAKCEDIFYFLDARKQLLQLGRQLCHGDSVAKPRTNIYSSHSLSSGKPLKILYISGMFPSFEHGGGLRLFDILSELSERHQVDLYARFNDSLDRKSLDLLGPKLAHLLCSGEPNETELLNWLKLQGIREGDYDIIQLEYLESVFFLKIAKKYGKRVGFTLMECMTRSCCLSLLSAVQSDTRKIGPLLAEILRVGSIECTGMRGSDFSIAVTREDAEFGTNLAQVRPEVVLTAVSPLILDECDAPELRDQVPEGPYAAFVGFFDWPPNIEGISWYIRSIHSAVVRAIPGYKLLVIGRGDTSSLRALAQADPSIVFTGRVDSVVPEIRRAAICIAPLISGAGIRGKINQYTVCERPTVSTTIGVAGMPYVNGQSIFIADQAEDFSRHMIKLLRDETLRTKIVQRAKEVVKEYFSWKQNIQQLESIYYDC